MIKCKIGVVFREIYAKNRASVSQTVHERPGPRPEGMVRSVAQLGLFRCKFYSRKRIKFPWPIGKI